MSRRALPTRAMRYRTQKGMEIHICAASRPGKPMKEKVGELEAVLLKANMDLRRTGVQDVCKPIKEKPRVRKSESQV